MCRILLSIKPEYVEKIINGKKTFEFRRNIPRRKVDVVVIYSTYPEKKIIGEFTVKEIHKEKIDDLWQKTQGNQGISLSNYEKYYNGKEIGFAYEIDKLTIYELKKTLSDFKISYAPQSFIYLD
ncbi:MAG: ASCH domain-containing protein [Mycoplasmatales bacterium]